MAQRGQNPETPIMHAVHQAMVKTGKCLMWRNNTGGVHGTVRSDNGRTYRANIQYGLGKGSADLVGIIIGTGRIFALEVKTPTGQPDADQRAWMHAVRSAGGFACVVRSPEDALEALERAIRGEVC